MGAEFRRRAPAVAALAVAFFAACASTPDLRFAPSVQDAELRDGDAVQARVVVAWRGLAESDHGPVLLFRIRVENPRAEPFALAPAEFVLLDAALLAFAPAGVVTVPDSVAPRADATFDLAFVPPAGRSLEELDLSVLSLGVRFEDGRWSWNTTFGRVDVYYADPYWYDPYWHSSWHFHAGAVWSHH